MSYTPPEPQLPPGHRIDRWITSAGGYWTAFDAQGYGYVVGAHAQVTDGRTTYTEVGANGSKREWMQTPAGWARSDSAGAVESYRGRQRVGGLEPWLLPDGRQPTYQSEQHRKAVDRLRDLTQAIIQRTITGPGAWIHGPAGSGKTLGLDWIGLSLAHAGLFARAVSVATMAATMRASYGKEPDKLSAWQTLQSQMEAADVLLLDDVGAEGSGDDIRAELLRIVDMRIRERLPMVATSNYDQGRLSATAPAGPGMDPRLASRFGALAPVYMGDIDHRKLRVGRG